MKESMKSRLAVDVPMLFIASSHISAVAKKWKMKKKWARLKLPIIQVDLFRLCSACWMAYVCDCHERVHCTRMRRLKMIILTTFDPADRVHR
jgi:hypothetical protein